MRHLTRLTPLILLLLPLPLLAAQALSNSSMEKAYVPETVPCVTEKGKTPRKGCEPSPTKSLTDKALRDAEQQGSQLPLNNPQINNPGIIPPPRELTPPPPEIPLPLQNELLHPTPPITP